MRGFAKALGKALRRPAILPVPGFALRLLVGEMAESLLTGQKALPRKAEKLGFTWTYPTLESALRNLVGKEEEDE
jgi:NAD dependent epimerase/dehydratase family enzyme